VGLTTRRVSSIAAHLVARSSEPLPYPGQHEARQLTRWNGSTLILVFAAVAGWSFLNGANGVVANTWIRFRQAPTAAGQAATNRSGRATVNDAQYLCAVALTIVDIHGSSRCRFRSRRSSLTRGSGGLTSSRVETQQHHRC
jgi:hypothetical protein